MSMKHDAHDINAIIRKIEDSPAWTSLDLDFMLAILRHAAGGGVTHLRSADPRRLRRYAILLHELGLLSVEPMRPAAGECYPRIIEITGITPDGIACLPRLEKIRQQRVRYSET
jgi:hypothetical protein